jgi:hemoglobin/transferrin/lactoferrin receptor protein
MLARRPALSCAIPALLVFTAAAAHAQTAPVTALDAVTTSATRTERVAGDVAGSVSVVDREEIERRQPQSIDDLVKDMPGVETNGVPRNTVRQFTVRGLSDERVVLRVDGVRNNFNAGHRGRVFLEPDLLKSMDVSRGPGALLFGSGALGGAVNMRTVDAEDILKPGANFGGRARVGFQTNNSSRLASLTGATRGYGGEVVGNVTRRSNGNYTDGRGIDIPYSGDEVTSGLLKGGYDVGNGHKIGISTLLYADDHTIPRDANLGNATTTSTIVDRDTKQRSFSVNWAYAAPSTPLIDLKTVVYRNEVDIYEKRVLPATAIEKDDTDLRTNGFDIQNTSRFSLFDAEKNALTIGVDGYRDEQSSRRNGARRTEYPNADQTVFGTFIQNEIEIGKVTVVPGVRYDRFEQSSFGNPTQKSDERFSPKASVAYQVTPWAAPYVSYAEAFRVPSLTERYVSGQHFPGNNFVANPNLKPETSFNKEGGVNLRFSDVFAARDRLRVRAAYFVNDLEDYIQQVVGSTTTTTTNVAEARIQGFEGEARYDSGRWFGTVGTSILRGENRVTKLPLADTPADKVTLGLGHRWMEWGLTLGGRVTASARQDRTSGSQPMTGGYAVWDFYASWTPEDTFLRDFTIDAGVDNAFNKVYRRSNWNSSTPAAFYESGRNAKVALTYKF